MFRLLIVAALCTELCRVARGSSEHILATKEGVPYGKEKVQYCPVAACADAATEQERWNCVAGTIFQPIPNGEDLSDYHFAQHDCGGVGWGNWIRAISNSVQVAAVTGRRLIISHFLFTRFFDPPSAYADGSTVKNPDWYFGMKDSKHSKELENWGGGGPTKEWGYENWGRRASHLSIWENFMKDPALLSVPKPDEPGVELKRPEYAQVIKIGTCGGQRNVLTEIDCLKNAMPQFMKCFEKHQLDETKYPAPFFHMIAQKPSKLMVEMLAVVRTRLGLPQLEAGLEEVPGRWGLRTPGYYLLGLHVRNYPVGFEQLAIDINKPTNLDRSAKKLNAFWLRAAEAANEARDRAACRGEELLIYFATDDHTNLRSTATEKLSKYGRVIFGLNDDEVGHMSSHWDDHSNELYKIAKEHNHVDGIGAYARGADVIKWEQELIEGKAKGQQEFKESPHVLPIAKNIDHSRKPIHGEMAFVEWFILANTQWLLAPHGSSYSDTAASLGLSPIGGMERFETVHSEKHTSSSYRNDWNGEDICKYVEWNRNKCESRAGKNNKEGSTEF